MVEFRKQEKKIIVKIVYYGPAMSGKTTNLMFLHDIMNPGGRGELMSFETKGDRTLFFDLLPFIIKKKDFSIKIKLFTVPGQVAHDATRKAVLSRADGIVFIADSQNSQTMNNFESFTNLEKNSYRVGLDFETMPLVVQFNKQDLSDIVGRDEVLEKWGQTRLPITFSSAIYGDGVKETFLTVLKRTYTHLDKLLGLKANHSICEEDFIPELLE
ncbi:MAG: GTPase [Desulfobacterales bacterium RIFOXYA12_FULL_46_15]|nr:MAG: GTPase [Desulfobacula sp. GWF2_41_7]OGR25061.1 MAG: GTPase [Desulfobacterales bacterium RIFOXYA12_FULL_46_15]